MVKITLGNALAITVMAVVGIAILKATAPFVPFEGYRNLIGGI